MSRIYSQDQEDVVLANDVLSWISYVKRPLTVTELQHALAISPGTINIDDDALTDEELLISVCAGMVTVDKKSSIIRLVHYTTQEYFEHIRNVRFPNAQVNITMSCLTYLRFELFNEACVNEASLERRMQNYKFSRYAAQHWADHARGDGENVAEIQNAIFKTFESVGRRDAICQIKTYVESPLGKFEGLKDRSLLQLIAMNGLATICGCLLDKRLDQDDAFVSDFLRWPTKCRQAITPSISIAAQDKDGRTSLHEAASYGHLEVLKLLLDAKAEVATQDNYGRTALHRAAWKGHSEVVKLLLDAKADVNTPDNDGWTALHQAAWNGHSGVVKLLLEAKIDVTMHDNDGWTAQRISESNGHSEVVKLLLNANVDVST